MSAKTFRTELGGDVLIAMAANDELPISDSFRVAKKMQVYFLSEGFRDDVKAQGYKWKPTADYWQKHLTDIRRTLRENKKLFFEYQRTEGARGFKGNWAFLRKSDFEQLLRYEHKCITTRANTHNTKIADGCNKWALKEPRLRIAIE